MIGRLRAGWFGNQREPEMIKVRRAKWTLWHMIAAPECRFRDGFEV
jgi:hypothetical protein